MVDIVDIGLAPTAMDAFAKSADTLAKSATTLVDATTENIPTLGNAALCADSICTAGRSGLCLYWTPNPVAKAFFGASCVCGIVGATSSGIALGSAFLGIPAAGALGTLSARGFNRLGKLAMHMGQASSGNITDATQIAELISNSTSS